MSERTDEAIALDDATRHDTSPDQPQPNSIDQRLFELTLDLIVIVDRSGTIIRASPSARTILGYDPQELVGKSGVQLLYPDDLEHTRNEMRLARRRGTMRNFDCRYMRKDGQVATLT